MEKLWIDQVPSYQQCRKLAAAKPRIIDHLPERTGSIFVYEYLDDHALILPVRLLLQPGEELLSESLQRIQPKSCP